MPNIPEIVTLTLNLNQANMVLYALGEMPWKQSNDLILEIRQQLTRQINPSRQEDNIQTIRPGNTGD